MAKKRIVDEFTDLKVSRQRKYQLRQAAKRKCVLCGRKCYQGSVFCKSHLLAKRDYQRKRDSLKAA